MVSRHSFCKQTYHCLVIILKGMALSLDKHKGLVKYPSVKFAKCQGDAIHNLTGNILGLIPLYGDGDIWLEIYDLDLYAQASVLINEDGFVRVTEMKVSANFTSIKLHLDNLLGGGNFGESINNLLNLLGDYIWDQLKDILFPLLESVN